MIALKAIHPSFRPTSPTYTLHHTRSSFLCLCKSNESDSQSPSPQPEGDAQNQELLAQMAILQTQKVRLTDYLDERSAYLAQFGEETKAEFDKIGEDALKGLDEASDRITANIESQMLAFEEATELNKLEIQESEDKLMEFEGQMEEDRNEGLFFKNLSQKVPVVKAKVKEEVEEVKDVSREKDGSKTRKNVYLFFIGLLTYGIVNSIASSSSTDWRKVAVLGAILVALFSTFIYEQNKENKKEDQ
ncbi:hypothetical protein SESBI_21329 [Sesbania bispinosa]|nr:hypothetical protein SESBI_21329 [Sesbania bispinosa]